MQRFTVDLKKFLGLAVPNQYCPAVTKQIFGWLWSKILGPETSNLHDPYINNKYRYKEKNCNFTIDRDHSYKKYGNKGGHVHLQIF